MEAQPQIPKHCPQCNNALEVGEGTKLAFCPGCRFPLVLLANKYRFEQTLEQGGFGTVYLAHHIHLDRETERVIKVIKPEVFEMKGMDVRFRREVQVTAALSQRNEHIVRIYDDFGFAPQLGHYYVMEFLRGQTLKQRLLEEPPLSHAENFQILQQICKAISAAHKENIVHRDLKPENVFLIPRDDDPHFVKVIDFGIAKPIHGSAPAMTQGALGTPLYMAPEQCLAKDIDERTDIYALGIMFYEMLTGRTPFFEDDEALSQSSVLAILNAQITQKPPPMRPRNPEIPIPDGLQNAVLRALRKKPQERYPNIDAFWQAMRPYQTPTPAPIPLDVTEIPHGGPKLEVLSRDNLPTPFSSPHQQQLPSGIMTPSHSAIEDSAPTAVDRPAPVSGVVVPGINDGGKRKSNVLIGLVVLLVGGLSMFGLLWQWRQWHQPRKAPPTLPSDLSPHTAGLSARKAADEPPARPDARSPSIAENASPDASAPRRTSPPPPRTPARKASKATKPKATRPKIRRRTPLPRRRARIVRRRAPRRRVKRRRAPRRRVVVRIIKRRRVVRRRVVRRPGVCPSDTAKMRWLQAKVGVPAGRWPRVTFPRCRSCRMAPARPRRHGFCIRVPKGRKIQVHIVINGYQSCTHTLSTRHRRIQWRLKKDDPNELADDNYKCFRRLR